MNFCVSGFSLGISTKSSIAILTNYMSILLLFHALNNDVDIRKKKLNMWINSSVD